MQLICELAVDKWQFSFLKWPYYNCTLVEGRTRNPFCPGILKENWVCLLTHNRYAINRQQYNWIMMRLLCCVAALVVESIPVKILYCVFVYSIRKACHGAFFFLVNKFHLHQHWWIGYCFTTWESYSMMVISTIVCSLLIVYLLTQACFNYFYTAFFFIVNKWELLLGNCNFFGNTVCLYFKVN